jgi:hypothetical protein
LARVWKLVAMFMTLALTALALTPAAGAGEPKTETLRFFSKEVSTTLTHPDGSVERGSFSEPQPGDVLDFNSLDYVGDHRRHAKRWSASDHGRCEFTTGEPKCISHVAIGGSLLVFEGFPGKLINGTGRYV